MMDLDELRIALNWDGVYQGRDCLVVKFEQTDAGKINGLRRNDQCFYFDFPEFQEHPVSFLVTYGPHESFQYWVLGDRLHRVSGPAKISSNTHTKISHLTHYLNGVKHNPVGPAEIIIRNHTLSDTHPKTTEPLGGDYVAEEWDEMECYWFEHGLSPLYPKPFSILCEDGHRIFRTSTQTPMLDDFRGEAAFFAHKVLGNWHREADALSNDMFRLRYIALTDYERSYDHGEPQKHKCASIDKLNWIIHGEYEDTPVEKRERVNRTMFSEWNIWEGPLFPNAQEEVFVMGEINS